MYIEFDLPQGAVMAAAGYAHQRITIELSRWAEQHNNIKYTTKTIKFKYRVCFSEDRFYTYFQLTWSPDNYQKYRIVKDLNNKV
jgi:hypothetical protein